MSSLNESLRAALAAAALLGAFAGAAMADPGVVRIQTPSGEVYADANHMTLYTFDNDTPGVSNCDGQCAVNWPPLVAPADATATGDFAPIQRSNGTMQWALNGKPLYLWIKDTQPGEMTGDGVNGVWHVAR
ncbi:hypothetical protein GI374_11750 [Paracoccus sp. S-4012]|uniref:COG4315 family predicted lipoprotein n=1 Tax=Paracoccus sp. S-4012 TaxID=2665648 RepID=UPI0012B0F1A1|nr:hypothetical protein [Paracoccus sp. S-4012]MRX51107.1 hypothetical protein [Paracoccus sp. S-4012]